MNLQLIKQDKFNDILVDVYRNDSNEVFMTIEQLANALEYSDRNSVEKIMERNEYLKNEEFSVQRYLKCGDNKAYNCRLFNENGIKAIVQLSKVSTETKLPILEYLGEKVYFLMDTDEHRFLQIIMDVFRDKNTKREYKIGNYRVDLAFVNEMLIIECDEYGHTGYCEVYEKERESYLTSKGYKIMRFNPNDKQFRIGLFIADIIETINNMEELR